MLTIALSDNNHMFTVHVEREQHANRPFFSQVRSSNALISVLLNLDGKFADDGRILLFSVFHCESILDYDALERGKGGSDYKPSSHVFYVLQDQAQRSRMLESKQ